MVWASLVSLCGTSVGLAKETGLGSDVDLDLDRDLEPEPAEELHHDRLEEQRRAQEVPAPGAAEGGLAGAPAAAGYALAPPRPEVAAGPGPRAAAFPGSMQGRLAFGGEREDPAVSDLHVRRALAARLGSSRPAAAGAAGLMPSEAARGCHHNE